MAAQGDDLHIARLGWRLDALDLWRERTDKRLTNVETTVSEIVKADEIAEAISAKVHSSKQLRLTISQKVLGGSLMLLTIASLVRGFFH